MAPRTHRVAARRGAGRLGAGAVRRRSATVQGNNRTVVRLYE